MPKRGRSSRRTNALLAALVVLGVVAGGVPAVAVRAVDATPTQIALSSITADPATTIPTSFVLVVDTPGATSAKLVVDGTYQGRSTSVPPSFELSLTPGPHRIRVRTKVGTDEFRTDLRIEASSDPPVPSPPGTTTAPLPTPIPTITLPPGSTTVPTVTDDGRLGPPTTIPTPPIRPGEQLVDTVHEIRTAVANARPGDVIVVADGEYLFRPRLVASASGTPGAPITLRGTRNAVIRTRDASGDYGLHITGDHWRIEGITVAHASKGIVLDGSIGTVIDGVEVHTIGAEGVHFRSCSSDGVLRRSHIHHTGLTSPQFGEGVYVGSASSNWSRFACVDPIERRAGGDNTERVVIEDNLFEDTTAEGADLKEGTDSGIVRNNVFRRSGTSGMNSADSAVDAKGNGWLITDNVVVEGSAPWLDGGISRPSAFRDGFQTHRVHPSYGTRNVFHGNVVVGRIPGFVVGTYPMLDNVVGCSNTGDAIRGPVGDGRRAVTCRE